MGTLAPEACADLVVLEWSDEAEPLVELEGGWPGTWCDPYSQQRAARTAICRPFRFWPLLEWEIVPGTTRLSYGRPYKHCKKKSYYSDV